MTTSLDSLLRTIHNLNEYETTTVRQPLISTAFSRLVRTRPFALADESRADRLGHMTSLRRLTPPILFRPPGVRLFQKRGRDARQGPYPSLARGGTAGMLQRVCLEG
ncbi:hypothetical protein T310_2050 [Rasamsonia emersonii CBS 393.64]|uniref:Uncharacterized protein n=1 Tax=Rasamsonia emersonii (strain ATCC 16479 / CBS 393.64 / IMI 116815) TaxID=1408163 RepID=A0A0F4Z1C4_RASE3|nr:hypothetical protein T310_2050 [Rasamsonia emersonii CBS 393.64]KKA23901.1 hypothetical protein T310_2050 [Rasamsonia emersonii CBS 393.64]